MTRCGLIKNDWRREDQMKDIIVYYSNSGTTVRLAWKIQGTFGGQVVELKPSVPYGNYFAAVVRAGKERKRGIVPEYTAAAADFSGVDVVFVGYPIWYSDAPAIVLDYVGKIPLEGKTLIPFSTSSVSSIKPSLAKLTAAAKGANVIYPYSETKLVKDNFDKWVATLKKNLPR